MKMMELDHVAAAHRGDGTAPAPHGRQMGVRKRMELEIDGVVDGSAVSGDLQVPARW